MKKTSGYTLIELLVVLAIIGIVTSITLMNVGDGGRRRNIELDQQALDSRIHYYQKQAVLLHQPIGLHLSQKVYVFSEWDKEKSIWSLLKGQYDFAALPRMVGINNESQKLPKKIPSEPQIVLSSDGLVTPFYLLY